MKPIPTTHEEMICCGKKVALFATLKSIFRWVGLTLGWGVRRFHNKLLCFPTQHDLVYRKHRINNRVLAETKRLGWVSCTLFPI